MAGTHGKTTTTALLAWVFEHNGLNPSYLIGGIPNNLGQGARELTVRMKGRVNSVPDFDAIVVATRAGAQITLAQVGRAEDGTEEPETAWDTEGAPETGPCISVTAATPDPVSTGAHETSNWPLPYVPV